MREAVLAQHPGLLGAAPRRAELPGCGSVLAGIVLDLGPADGA
jgi:hypothetical protein